jgi:hypothetical protein
MTFMDRFMVGRARVHQIDGEIHAWHEGDDDRPLDAYLGLTGGEYAAWAECRLTLEEIAAARTGLHKIVSGGQTGVDQGALDAALILNVARGGWAPKGWETEAGPRRDLEGWGLVEHEGGYAARTEANVRDSEGTILICRRGLEASGGTALTRRCALSLGRPLLEVQIEADRTYLWLSPRSPGPSATADWLRTHSVRVANVAGNRESRCPGIRKWTEEYLCQVIARMRATPPR